jgi:hypothetical protein
VEESNVRHHPDYPLAVNFQQQAQHTMSGWVLRTHIQDHRGVFCRIGNRPGA